MVDIHNQRKIAASLLKVGKNRVWINPDEMKKVSGAITREDVRNLIAKGIISKRAEIGTSRVRARARQVKRSKGRSRGTAANRGKRTPTKRDWINTIRPIRRLLKGLLQKKEIDKETYKDLYAKASGGFFRSKTHVKLHLQKGAETTRRANQ